MNKIIYMASFLFFLLAYECYSQEEKSAGKDTVQKLNEDSLLNKLKDGEFLFNNFPLIYKSRLNNVPDSVQLNPGLSLNSLNIIPDPLSNFKRNLYDYLSFYYNSMPNYDLGIVGRYLLYLKKMTAIYLAVMALM